MMVVVSFRRFLFFFLAVRLWHVTFGGEYLPVDRCSCRRVCVARCACMLRMGDVYWCCLVNGYCGEYIWNLENIQSTHMFVSLSYCLFICRISAFSTVLKCTSNSSSQFFQFKNRDYKLQADDGKLPHYPLRIHEVWWMWWKWWIYIVDISRVDNNNKIARKCQARPHQWFVTNNDQQSHCCAFDFQLHFRFDNKLRLNNEIDCIVYALVEHWPSNCWLQFGHKCRFREIGDDRKSL